jgi:hypothetical protein
MMEFRIAAPGVDQHGPAAGERCSRADVSRGLSPVQQYLAVLCALGILGSTVGACLAAVHTLQSATRDAARAETCQRTYAGNSLGESDDSAREILICWDTQWNLGIPSPGDGR